ncbi:MAG: hypothetical protein WC450_06460 [Candidatus Omnitrophota bacterium]|jgi:predicted amino acid dehydrogenase
MDFVFFSHVKNYSDLIKFVGKEDFERNYTTGNLCDKYEKLLHDFCEYDIPLEVRSCHDPNNRSKGYIKFLPVIPAQIVKNGEKVLDMIASLAVKYKLINVKLVGLGGLLSTIGDRGESLSREHDVFVSSGNSLTSYLAVKSILDLVASFDIPSDFINILIVGATGDIGYACFRLLANKFTDFILFGRDIDRLKKMYENDSLKNHLNLSFTTKLDDSIGKAHVIISATSSPIPLFDVSVVNPGTIICDISYPSNFSNWSESYANTILLFEGGKAYYPQGRDIKHPVWEKWFSNNIIFGCLTEILTLSLEKTFIPNLYDINKKVSFNNCQIIYDKAIKHGFSVAPYSWQGYRYSDNEKKGVVDLLKKRGHLPKNKKNSL